jgi:hypothetical protein
MKFGEALERMDLNLIDTSVTRIGAFSFGSLKKFLTNKPSRFEANTFGNNTGRGLRQTLFGLYFQDDWRWHPNLMVNLGLRYEMTTVPTEVTGKLSTLINITDTQPHLGNPFFLNPTLRNFEPRVGFAWDPFRSGKSVLRGGFGLYDVLPLANEYLSWIVHATPFFGLGTVSGANLPAGTFYAGAFPLLTSGSVEASYLEHNPHRNYVMQWNLNAQRELTPSLRGMIGYVGSRGVHQAFHSDDIDIVLPTVTPQGLLWPSPIVPGGTTLNPSFSAIKSTTWGGNSYYHALEAQITKAMSHGIQLQGSFTWGKSIDTSSSASISDQYSNSVSSLYWPNLALGRGLSDFNIGRTLVISSTWQVPSPKSFSGLAAWITNGWELGGIYKANDGVPFTATFGRDGDPLGLNSSDPWDFPNRLGGPGCSSLTNPGNPNQYIKTQCFAVPTAPSNAFYTANCDPNFGTPPQCFNLRGNAGRNILIGPGLSNLDFSLFKNNSIKRISENFNVQFRAEVFNILNRANFDVPAQDTNTQIFDSTGAPNGVAGQLTSTTTTARQIQFALKLVW